MKLNSSKIYNIFVFSFRIYICLSFIFFYFSFLNRFSSYALSVDTTVMVGNQQPTFTNGPFEDPSSSSITPTNVGESITFKATATDTNGDHYYLILCSTNSASASNGGSPSCTDTTWCVSNQTTSGSEASCSRTALVGDSISNTWYAFVCDDNPYSAQCSSASQGSGESGSPFEVNHSSSFSSISNNSGIGVDPGSTITWSSTASDTDSDNIKLLVCKTEGLSGDTCDGGSGDTWCSSSFVASNPSCQYITSSVFPDGIYNSYTYIVDEHYFGSSSANQGSNVSFTINNVAPTVSTVTINGGTAINLTENSTKSVTLTATVTDNNSAIGTGEVSTGVEMNSLIAFSITSSINYGLLNIEQSNDPLDRTTTTTPTGNTGLDHEVSGGSMCTDYPTCAGSTITVGNQKYSLTASTSYSSASSLSATPTTSYINVAKPTSGTPTTKNMWWGMLAPTGTNPGTYTGAITVTGIKSNITYW